MSTSGITWSSPAGVFALGGVGQQVNIGELEVQPSKTITRYGLEQTDPIPQVATITLGIRTQNPGVALSAGGRLYAWIKYGVGNSNEEVMIDWLEQQSITLPAGKFTIVACQADAYGLPFVSNIAGFVVNPAQVFNAGIILNASVTAGVRSSASSPTLTQTVDVAPGVFVVNMRVPQRAKRVLVGDHRGQAGSDLTVTVAGTLAINYFDLANAADSAIRTEGVVLPGGTEGLSLNSAGVFGLPVCWILDG